MPKEVHVDFKNISAFAQLYMSVFNAPPWNDGWSEAAVVERLESLAQIPRFYGIGLLDDSEIIRFMV